MPSLTQNSIRELPSPQCPSDTLYATTQHWSCKSRQVKPIDSSRSYPARAGQSQFLLRCIALGHVAFSRYPPLALWRRYLAAPKNSRSFYLKCGLKQACAAVTYGAIEDCSPAGEGGFHQLQPRVVELPCDIRLIARSEKNTFFCGAEHEQRGVASDCFVQVQTTSACSCSSLLNFRHCSHGVLGFDARELERPRQ